MELTADEGCSYDGEMELNLSELVPLCACPHQPDNVIPLKDVEKKKVQQVFIGSCTNASYSDIAKAALVFQGQACPRGRKLHLRHFLQADLPAADEGRLSGNAAECGRAPAGAGLRPMLRHRPVPRPPKAWRCAPPTGTSRAGGNPTAEIYLVNPKARRPRPLWEPLPPRRRFWVMIS